MNVIKGSMCYLSAFVELHYASFTKHTWFTKLQLFDLVPPSIFCFSSLTRPFPLTCPNLMHHSFVFVIGFVDAIPAEPLTTSTSKVYNCFLLLLKTSFVPFMTLKIQCSRLNTPHFLSNSPREIRFLLRSGAYLILVNNLIDSSRSLNLTRPIPVILHAQSFPRNTDPPY